MLVFVRCARHSINVTGEKGCECESVEWDLEKKGVTSDCVRFVR